MNAAIVDILRATVGAMDAANAGEYHHFPNPHTNTQKIQLQFQTARDNKSVAVLFSIWYSFSTIIYVKKNGANIKNCLDLRQIII